MSITYSASSNEIVVEGGIITFGDIYREINDEQIVSRLGRSFQINANLRLKAGTILKDKDKSVVITEPKFQIEKGSALVLGVYTNKGASRGCTLTMTKPLLRYGFGEETLLNDSTQSGNIFLYNSKLDIDCFWGFFSGPEQKVEIVDCLINGFGRVQGYDSVVKDCIFTDAHSKYGILQPKGQLKEYSNLSVRSSSGAAVYFNPTLADNQTMLGGRFENYVQLVYCEHHTGSYEDTNKKVIKFVDSDIRGNRKVRFGKDTKLEIAYTFAPKFINKDNEALSGAEVVIKNLYDEEVFSGTTDEYGSISTQLVVYEDSDETAPNDLGPFWLCLSTEDFTQETYFDVAKPIDGVPFAVLSNGDISEVVETDQDQDQEAPDSIDLDVQDSAESVIYVASSQHSYNELQKQKIRNVLGSTVSGLPTYVDIARNAYDKTPAFDTLLMKALAGEINKIIVYEPEVFGYHRYLLIEEILQRGGIELVSIREIS